MQYSRILLVLILSVSGAVSYGQQQPSPAGNPRRLPMMCEHAAPPRGTHWACNDANNPCNCRLESDTPGKQPFEDDDGQLIKKPEPEEAAARISAEDFYRIMNTVAQGRSEGNASKAAGMFGEDAVYSNPAGEQTHKGRAAIAKLFSGNKGGAIAIQWHHLLFNEQEQIGAGEFTQEGRRRFHGMVIVKMKNGKISNWREYGFASNEGWEKFTSDNQF
ncbi:MAG TPA: nuclear transport factor 2 family protein [Terriglobales bacterium]|jgi:hypothetical protein|nr:nuclear transport factor 2 family protein [Terriglobales bacterium]